tara:strand:+ start:5002 stop:5901 length:900 start_codon:yes stop_codon:yes gene_type:complete
VLNPRFYFLIILSFITTLSFAQEFECQVTLNYEQLEGNSFNYLTELEDRIEEYVNDFQWTEYQYAEEERISCQIQLIIESGNSNFNFGSRVIFTARRPIYDTVTKTNSIILSDENWQFNYPEGRTLIHDKLQFDNLTGTLDFFMNIILGYDFDSFSELGGTPYFRTAQDVVDLAQTTSAIGWTRAANNRRNRFNLIADLLNPTYEPLRTAYYSYHRLGLDQFSGDAKKARQEILGVLTLIRDTKRRATSNYLFDVFFNTKAKEISGAFNEAEAAVKRQAYSILLEADQGHLTEYTNLQN